jgi:iron complex transport system substrate-binding protein
MLAAFVALPAAAQGDTVCEPGFRLFDHEVLATDALCIPEHPQRIAFIDGTIAMGISLGVPSITNNYYFRAFLGDFPALLDEEAIAQMVDVGDTWEINAEALLLAEPDLIISATWWEDTNATIKPIAPLVIIDFDKLETWLPAFDAVAQITGKTEEAGALLAAMDERIATLRDLIAESETPETISLTIIESPDMLWTFTEKNFGVYLAKQAGIPLADGIPTPEEAAATGDGAYAMSVSLENLPLIDADHVFLFTNFGSDVEKELFVTPVWQAFEGINPERVHFLEAEYWVRDHPIAAHRVLDDLFTYVAQVDPAEVSPNPFAYTYQLPDDAETSE